MELRKNRKAIPCYWESQPVGCLKEHCPFLHQLPRPSVESSTKSSGNLTFLLYVYYILVFLKILKGDKANCQFQNMYKWDSCQLTNFASNIFRENE